MLLFIGSRILPAVCIFGTAHIFYVNWVNPMTEEDRRILKELRSKKRISGSSQRGSEDPRSIPEKFQAISGSGVASAASDSPEQASDIVIKPAEVLEWNPVDQRGEDFDKE